MCVRVRMCVSVQNNEHKIKGNSIPKISVLQFIPLSQLRVQHGVSGVEAFDSEAVKKKKSGTQCKQQETAKLSLYVVFQSPRPPAAPPPTKEAELIIDLHTKTLGYKMLRMCNCLRLLSEDCCAAVSSQRFAFTKRPG